MLNSSFRTLLIAIASVLLLGLTGCASLNDVVQAKESGREGTTKDYQVTFDQAWAISKAVFRWEGSDAIEEHREQGYMLTSSGMTFLSPGTVMGAWVEPSANNAMRVTVVTKRRVQTALVTTLTESTFHRRFAQAVEIVKQGKPLPAVAPQ